VAAVAKRHGISEQTIYTWRKRAVLSGAIGVGVSQPEGREGCACGHADKRPAFDALCRDAAKRQFDMVMGWSVDRLGRSLHPSCTRCVLICSRTSRASIPRHRPARPSSR
jgi:hypothetical protein